MYYNDGTTPIGSYAEQNREIISCADLPDYVGNAIVASEDRSFYTNKGIDPIGIARAFYNNLTTGSRQGGSTITQQYAERYYLGETTSYVGKLREAFLAVKIAQAQDKSQVLCNYMNTIYLGRGAYGIQAAAKAYFGKDAKDLTVPEAAMLAGIIPSPSNWDPAVNAKQAKSRFERVINIMKEDGYITAKQASEATMPKTVTNAQQNIYEGPNGYLLQMVRSELINSKAFTQDDLDTGGYTIEATVNPKMQTAMENLMLNTDDAYFPAGWHEEEVTSISDDDVQVMNEDGTPKTRTGDDGTVYYYRNVRTQAAMVTLDYDGNVLAMVGGLGKKTKSLSLNRAYGVTRQTGSTIKPIGAYALGIEYGLVNWSTMLNNSPLYLKQDMVIRDEDYCRKNGLMGMSDTQLKAYPNAWRSWPRNYGGNYGDGSDLPLWNGLARSLNTIAIRVGDLVGANNIFNFVYNTLQLSTLDPVNDVGLAQMVMGSQTHGVTPMALAAAFQIFYDGEYTTPHLYTRVLDRDGNIYMESNDTSYQALTPQTAYVMNRLLKNVLFSSVGTASGRYPNSNGMEAFGKTGTASDEKDLWFVGGTPYYVTAVWWGYDAPYDMTKTLSKQQAKTRTCVMAWKALMEQAQADLPYKAFPTSAGVVERRYCTQSGLLAGAGCPSTAVGYYRADDLPDTCTYSHAAPQAAAPAENTDDAVPTQPVIPTDTSALDTE